MIQLGPQGCQCDLTLDLTSLDGSCGLVNRPIFVTGIILEWLRLHFSDTTNLENTTLQDWATNPTGMPPNEYDVPGTLLLIDSVYRWNPALTALRPALLVKRGPWKVVRRGIDDRKMMRTTNRIGCDEEYITFFQGSHMIFCIGESAEVEYLAAEVAREFVEFGPVARKFFGFHRFVVSDIGEVSILEEAKERFVVPVVVSYAMQDAWAICQTTDSLFNLFQEHLAANSKMK